MTNELQIALQNYDAGRLSLPERVRVLLHLLNTNHDLVPRYGRDITTLQQAGIIALNVNTRVWFYIPPAPPKNKGGRPASDRDMVAVTIYMDRTMLERFDDVVRTSPFSRSGYINVIIQRFLKDRT